MKLYGITLSPYVARVRLALRLKGLSCEMVPPPGGGTRSAEYLAINPIGKIPALVTDDGLVIAESETIIDYLDELQPDPPLLPQGAAHRAQMRNAIRCFELYVTPSMSRLFRQMDPATRNEAVVADEIAHLQNGLALTAGFVDDAAFAVGGKASKADCMLLPGLLLAGVAASIFGRGDVVAQVPRLAAYREQALRLPDVATIWQETADALAAFRAGQGN